MDSLFNRYNYRPETIGRPARKVVNIPVTFVGASRSQSKSDSALRIQSAFRGYLVRRTFRKIAAVRAEVLEVERSVREEGETLELLRKEEKERVRVNERLMSLLLRLDSVSGVDHGIRELRRAVIKKAIALQDAVDAIADRNADVEVHRDRKTEEADGCGGDDVAAEAIREDSSAEAIRLDETVAEDIEYEDLRDRNHEADGCGGDDAAVERSREDSSADGYGGDDVVVERSQEDSSAEADVYVGDDMAAKGSQEDSRDLEETVDDVEEGEDGCGFDDLAAEREKEAVETMREDNKRMMGMMAELLERNGEQMRLLTSLSHRVEMLERAFLWDRLRRKMNTKAKRAGLVDPPMDDCNKSDERR